MNTSDHTVENFVQWLGQPYCRGDRYAIFQIDCVDAMKSLPDSVIDLTVTSPPYNIGKEYENPLPLEAYIAWCRVWMGEIHRLTRPHGAFWLNLGYVSERGKGRAIPLPYLLWNQCPFFMVQEVVWNYGAGVAGRNFLSPRNEKLLWFVKDESHYTFNLDAIRDPDVKYPNQKKNGKLRCNTVGKNPSDVWQIAKVTSGANRASPERTPHPAQFPIDLVNRVVDGFSNTNDIVIDPFMGSGTTAESCILRGRTVIGFEVRRDYCEVACKRLRKVSSDRRAQLFEVT